MLTFFLRSFPQTMFCLYFKIPKFILNLDLCTWHKRLSSELIYIFGVCNDQSYFITWKLSAPLLKHKLWSSILYNFVLFKWFMWARYLIFNRLTARGILCLKLACFILWCDYRLIIEYDFCSNRFLTLTSCSSRDNIFCDPKSVEKLLNNWHILIDYLCKSLQRLF